LPEALEKWSITLFEYVLPRHLQIINEINVRFLEHVARVWPGDSARLQRMAIIAEGEPGHIHMGHLAIVGSHSVNGVSAPVPRTYIFAGKAAPGYWAAKQIIKLIHNVGRVINTDPRVQGQLRVVFIPDYRVSLAEKIIPAADLSEQISMAGTEASGTGNMKFALNGALTIGTLDGANIEIMQEVGEENIFTFGLQAHEIHTLRAQGAYEPREYYMRCPALKRVLDTLASNCFCRQEPDLFRWIYHALLDQGDRYFHLADLPSYIAVQAQVGAEFSNPARWACKAILNVARVGIFSSDRTIRQYAKDIWQIASIPEGSSAR
jgi:starch phosphorylase